MRTNRNNIDEIILLYFRKLEERGLEGWIDRVFPTAKIFEKIEAIAGRWGWEAVEMLAEEVERELHPETAGEVLGVPAETAVRILAKKLAMWYLQLARELGVVKW
ncbi:MAG: hypothetical protein ACK4SY_03980 [Pyrobaculum sp.]